MTTGGGLPIGSMLLIEEDKYATYTKSLVKYFLAEGAVHKNALFIASLDDDCQEFVIQHSLMTLNSIKILLFWFWFSA